MSAAKKTPFFSFWDSVTKSFSGKALYQDVAANWEGKALNHLMIRIVAIWIFAAIIVHTSFSNLLSSAELSGMILSFPPFSVTNGEFHTDVSQPLVLNYGVIPFIVIDTSGTISSLDNRPEHILVTDTEITARFGDSDLSLTGLLQYDYICEGGLEFLDLLTRWLPIISFSFFVTMTLTEFLIRIVELTILSSWAKRRFRFKGEHDAVFRVCSVALTPGIILTLVFGINFPIRIMLSLLFDIYFCGFAVSAASEGKNHLISAIEEKLRAEQTHNEDDDDDFW